MEKSIFKTEAEWRNSSRLNLLAYHAAKNRGLLPKIRKECGWETPNVYKPMGYWTLEICMEIALRYNTPSEWQKGDKGSYLSALRNNWLGECCKHMVKKKPNGYWTLERCMEIALRYKTRKEWEKGDHASYSAAIKHGWLKECCKHMVKNK